MSLERCHRCGYCLGHAPSCTKGDALSSEGILEALNDQAVEIRELRLEVERLREEVDDLKRR